jgi:hypothetical protein
MTEVKLTLEKMKELWNSVSEFDAAPTHIIIGDGTYDVEEAKKLFEEKWKKSQ